MLILLAIAIPIITVLYYNSKISGRCSVCNEEINYSNSKNNVCSKCWAELKKRVVVNKEIYHVNINAKIIYTDRDGEITERKVRMISFFQTTHDYSIKCYCYSKKAGRTFHLSKISNMIDTDTGEEVKLIKDYLFEKARTNI